MMALLGISAIKWMTSHAMHLDLQYVIFLENINWQKYYCSDEDNKTNNYDKDAKMYRLQCRHCASQHRWSRPTTWRPPPSLQW